MDIENIEKSVKLSRWIVSSIFVVTLGSYVGWFFLSQGQVLSVKSGDWGAFGDFVGGLLNPLIAYSAFYWLTVSVIVQKRELAETKKALVDSSKAQQEQVKVQIEQVEVQKGHLDIQKDKIINQRNEIIAQQKQVKEAFRSSAIEVINMQLNNISMQLESEYAYRNGVALNAMQTNNAVTMARDGRCITADKELVNCAVSIAELENEQLKLILNAQDLLNHDGANIAKGS